MINQNSQTPFASYSLEADMITGWKPKLKIIGPMPLNFDNKAVDKSIMALVHQQSAFYQIVYLGPRPASSFKLHSLIAQNYRYKYAYLLNNDFAHLKPFFKKFYSLFEPQVRRPFLGMNPNLGKTDLIFDSCFESGNLDCAVRLKNNQYDLLLRVDSNTAGHIMWFDFKVINPESQAKCIKFNIVNLRKNKSAYERGMRPYVKRQGRPWQQEAENIVISQESLKYEKQNLTISLEQNQPFENNIFRKVSFQLTLEPFEDVQIAYCVPYTYTQLLEDIKSFRKKASLIPDVSLQVNMEHESLSGLEIPIINLRSGSPGNGKYCVFLIARQHPGETVGSHTIKGSIDQLLSGQEATMQVLKNTDFVIVPMLNPDGVVAGNFRTSLFGKDLNRLWKSKDTTLIPEIEMCRNIFTELVETYKKKLLLFMDYHGHSTRKNAFLLGPGIFDAQLMSDIRILPKIMANYSSIFRYPSCSFRLDANRKTTARALFGKFAGLSYTVETSNWAYYSYQTRQIFDMKTHHFQQLGRALFKGVQEFVINKLEAKNKYLFKTKEEDNKKMKIFKTKQDVQLRKSVTTREMGNKQKSRFRDMRTKTEQLIPDLEVQPSTLSKIKQETVEVYEQNSSDEMSQDGMDSDSVGEDMEDGKFKKYVKNATNMLVEFEMYYYGDSFKKGLSKYKDGSKSSNKLLFQKVKKKKEDRIQLQPCLRQNDKKMDHGEQSKTRRRVYVEDNFPRDFRENLSRNKIERKEIQREGKQQIHSIYHNRFQSSRKNQSRKNQNSKQQFALTEELTKVKKLQIIQHDRSSAYKRQQRSTEKLKFSRNQEETIVNKESELKSTIDLPMIRNSRHNLEEFSPLLTKKLIPKSKDRFNQLLMSEQLLNKSSIANVLKLSKVEESRQ